MMPIESIETTYACPPVKQVGPFDAGSFGDLIREARIEEGVSQGELARRIGSHQSTIARLERGETAATLTTLERIANAMGMQVQISFRALPRSRKPGRR